MTASLPYEHALLLAKQIEDTMGRKALMLDAALGASCKCGDCFACACFCVYNRVDGRSTSYGKVR
jgi:hypothetical protein